MKKLLLLLGVAIAIIFGVIFIQYSPSNKLEKSITTTYAVGNMTCESCEHTLQDAIGANKYVYKVEANHEKGIVRIWHHPENVTGEQLKSLIREKGYTIKEKTIQVLDYKVKVN